MRGILRWVADFHNRTVAFRIGRWIITTYAFFAGTAFFTGLTVSLWYVARAGYVPGLIAKYHVLLTLPAIFLGLRVSSIATDLRLLRAAPVHAIVRPGYMLHGGIIGGAFGLLGAAARTHVPLAVYADSAALALPIGEAIARIGCHVYGCCWGRPTGGTIGIAYHNPDASVLRNMPHLAGVRLHAVQLYSSLFALALWGALLILATKKTFDGELAAAYGIAHSAGRIVLERFRTDPRGRLFGSVSHTSIYAALLFLAGVLLFAYQRELPNTPLSSTARWIDIAFSGQVLTWALPFSAFFFFTYGVHRGRVGSWISNRARGAAA